MLKIMDDIRHEHSEKIMFLNLVLQAPNFHNVVHSLQRVNDMVLIMVSVLLEVSLPNLVSEFVNGL